MTNIIPNHNPNLYLCDYKGTDQKNTYEIILFPIVAFRKGNLNEDEVLIPITVWGAFLEGDDVFYDRSTNQWTNCLGQCGTGFETLADFWEMDYDGKNLIERQPVL